MKIGVIIPNAGAVPLQLGVVEMAQAAEAAGAAGLWVSDHVVLSDDSRASYPYSPDGRITWNPDSDYLECLTVCSYIAAATSRCAVGTAILILPQRHVLLVAKQVATLDRLSGGRVVLGVGAGWNRAEMEALGYAFDSRGTRFDEMLAVLRAAWSGETSEFRGDELSVPGGLYLLPTPVDPEGPPLLVGGMTRPAIRRAAVLGDGWLGLAFVDQWDLEKLQQSATLMRELSAGRPTPARWVLKLHAPAERVAELPRCIEQAHELGFEEFAVEVPWVRGSDEGAAVTADLVSRFA